MLSLFPEDEIHRNYRYNNQEQSATDVWRTYRNSTKKRRKWFADLWDYPIDWLQKISTA